MSDPRYRDPRLDPPPMEEGEVRSRRIDELSSSNAMWGWIAGAVVVALVLLFVFGSRGPNTSDQATTTASPPAATTGQRTTPTPQPPPIANPSPTSPPATPSPAR
jgi:hypothetical protein